MNPLLRLHLHMVRGACMTVVTAIDVALADEEMPAPVVPPAPVPPAPEKERVFDNDPFKCEHPKSHWIAAPAMGHASRVLCQCGEEMEP